MREQILSIDPGLEERLSRGVSFFIMEGQVLDRFRKEFAMFDNSSTVIRFTAENPIPKEIIEKLVRAKVAEIETYAKKYDVDMTGYLWYFHADDEGQNFGAHFFKPPYLRVQRIPITPRLLSEFAERRELHKETSSLLGDEFDIRYQQE